MRRALFAITALFLIAGRAQDAAGQCSITSFEMNGVTTLCSDYGDDWRWTGPGGFTSTAMCIEAPVNGTYTLSVYDFATNTWSEPCSRLVGDPPAAPACGITGPDSVCAGSSVSWCAPEGDFTLAWSGPGGFQATATCISVSAPGTYTLTVTDAATGMSSEPCSQVLRLVDCTTPPDPISRCPAPARWWASVIGTDDPTLDRGRQGAIARDVDGNSAALDFGETPAGLHEVLSAARHGRSWQSARRHFAAVLANLAAAPMDVTDANGRPIGLSPDMLLDQISGVPDGTTLGEWVRATDATLARLDDRSGRSRSSREACRRIKSQAREINGGAHRSGCGGLGQNVLADDDDDDDMDGFGDDSMTGGFSGGSGPFSSTTSVNWTLDRSSEVSLDVLDLSGRRVKVLARGTLPAGTHQWTWDGRSDSGESLRPGAYFVTGRVGDVRLAKRLILIR